jgi:hypothetical protein
MHKTVYFWKDVSPLLRRFCALNKVSLNHVVNSAVQSFLGCCDSEELRLKAKLVALLHEEADLRRVSATMLRSGSYLPSYVEKTLREPGRPVSLIREGQVPLKALNPGEEEAFRKICQRREEIAADLAETELQLLRNVKPYRLKPDSWSRRSDKNKKKWR